MDCMRGMISDGVRESTRHLERLLTTDSGLGVVRHADAGHEIAIEASWYQNADVEVVR